MATRPPPPKPPHSTPPPAPRAGRAPTPGRGTPVRLPPPRLPDAAGAELFDDQTLARVPSGGPTIALAVTGSIAAYKSAEIARLLVKRGVSVIPLMTRAAREFLGPQTLSAITGRKVVGAMFDSEERGLGGAAGEVHIDLARQASLLVIAPATADALSRLAQGRADDVITALALCSRGTVLVAPAMHPEMWKHPATQRNVELLQADGRIELVGPVDGEVASGERGVGRMADPEAVVGAVMSRTTVRDLDGLKVLVTAGPTLEDIDPVRYLGNRSTGKMGFAVAERAAARGAEVTLIAGPVNLPTPFGVRRIDVRSAIALRSAVWQALGTNLNGTDALVMTAAVADYRPAEEHRAKVKRTDKPLALELVPNPDILAEIGAARVAQTPILVGFAVETDTDERIVAAALNKLESKRVDFVVANHAHDSFGKDDNRAAIVARGGAEALGVLSKSELADKVLDRVLKLRRG